MREVNHCLIYSLLSTLECLEVCEDPSFDPDNRERVQALFREFVLPSFRTWSGKWREKLKLSLAYFISRPDVLENDVLAALRI